MPEAVRQGVMTIEEWSDLDAQVRGELVRGRLEEEELPTFLHEAVVSWVLRLLGEWVARQGGWVFGSEAKFVVADAHGRKPDVSAFLPDDPVPHRNASSTTLPPSIMVEVVSATPKDGRRDRVEKRSEYAVFGVRWYWLLDPQLRTLEIFELTESGRYQVVLEATGGSHLAPGCDGLSIDLDALWSEIDRLPPE